MISLRLLENLSQSTLAQVQLYDEIKRTPEVLLRLKKKKSIN